MKKILSFLKVALPLAFGVFLIWYVFKDLTPTEKDELFTALKQADYFWIGISMIFGVLSHMSRAIRWKYTVKPLGKTPGFWNSFFTVMIGYVANYALPRLGEVTRPALLAKYEGLSFNKLFGTIVAERVADMVILAFIMGGVLLIELDMLKDLLYDFVNSGEDKFSTTKLIVLASVLLLGAGLFFFFLFSKSQIPIFVKIRTLLRGILEGLQSIVKMEDKFYFILHTLFIWVMYVGMYYICFFSLEETSNVPIAAVMASFVMGSLAIVFVQGGLGVFPIAIMETLILYGISKTSALALGWIIWSSQTVMIIVVGILSIPLLRLINKNKKIESTGSHSIKNH
ncbi:MAG: lysylphosphatidylglycerol synthase transmembrane domain-containing protein [Vicingaceae bacterium]